MRLLSLLILLVVSLASYAQDKAFDRKKILKEVKEYVKGENYTKVDAVIKSSVEKYPELQADAEFYNIWMNANYHLALAENKKIYLASNPDTLKYMEYIYKMYQYGFKCDSLESIPNEKGKVKRKYRKNVAAKMNFYRKNFENAGKYFYNKKDYARAYSYIDMYVSTDTLFHRITSAGESVKCTEKEQIKQMSVLAALSAYAAGKYDDVLKYLPVALTDTAKRGYMLEIGCKAYQNVGAEKEYVALLDSGFNEYHDNEYFFASLIKHYNEEKDYEKALSYARKIVKRYPENHSYWYVKGKEERFLEMYDSAIVSYGRALKCDYQHAETYSALGDIYTIKAQQVDASIALPASDPNYMKKRQQLRRLYQRACDNYEKAKLYAPDNTSLWLAGLKEAYFMLNKGQELQKLEMIK